jgi:hypothetical protein
MFERKNMVTYRSGTLKNHSRNELKAVCSENHAVCQQGAKGAEKVVKMEAC